MSESYIQYNKGGTSFVGPDAVAFFRAATIATGLELYGKHKILPNRRWTPTAMLAAARGITGKVYKRGEHLKAAADVRLWAQEMKAALPQLTGQLDSNEVFSDKPGGKPPLTDGG